ncbi:MAG TPA: hypothetical protein VE326_01155 [Candidatus Binatia bacterium]|nr:hypothetical protein [Candidatus Binatia bacterium]
MVEDGFSLVIRKMLVSVLLLLLLAGPASAQYMFLDVDGNGTSGAEDTLSSSGATQVSIWLVTNQNREGYEASCPGGGQLTVNSYEVILRAVDGQVNWGTFQNNQTSMSTEFGTQVGNSDFHTGYAGATALPPGKFKLGTLTVSVADGSPSLQIVPTTPLAGVYGTSFGSACTGQDNDNTLKLGTDWYDVDGAGAPSAPPSGEASLLASGGGWIVLGGNVIDGPYHLRMTGGRVTINGFSLPPPPSAGPPQLSRDGEQIAALVQRVTSLRDSLSQAGAATSYIEQQLRQLSTASPLVQGVSLSGGVAQIHFRSGFTFGLPLSKTYQRDEGSGPSRHEREVSTLRDLQKLVEMGCIVFIIDSNTQHVVSAVNAKSALAAASDIRAGRTPSGTKAYALPRRVKSQLERPARLVRQ